MSTASLCRRSKVRETYILARMYPTIRPLWSSATNETCGHVSSWNMSIGTEACSADCAERTARRKAARRTVLHLVVLRFGRSCQHFASIAPRRFLSPYLGQIVQIAVLHPHQIVDGRSSEVHLGGTLDTAERCVGAVRGRDVCGAVDLVCAEQCKVSVVRPKRCS